MKKILAILLGIFGLTSVVSAQFFDTENTPYKDAINYLAKKGVIEGYSDNSFKPYNTINRSEFTKIIIKSYFPEMASENNCFPDVHAEWFAPFICHAKKTNIVHGYLDGYFHPERDINLAESLKIVLETYKLPVNTSAYPNWYEGYYWYAEPNGLLNGIDKKTEHNLTRGEMAQLIYNVEKHLGLDREKTYCDNALPVSFNTSTNFVIVGRKMFQDTIIPFSDFKKKEGYNVAYYNLEDIICYAKGRDIPEQLRNFLKEAKAKTTVQYLLLVGTAYHSLESQFHTPKTLHDEWEMPIRYVEGERNIESIPTDQYYASLEGSWDINNNNVFGEYIIQNNTSEYTFKPDLYVGRVPVQSAEELQQWVIKTTSWKTPANPVHSEFVSAYCPGDYIKDDAGNPFHWPISYLHHMIFHYCINDGGGDIASYANQDKADYVSSYSHGNWMGVVKSQDYNNPTKHYGYELNKQSPGFTKPPILFIHGCEVGGLDYPGQSIIEYLIGKSDGVTAAIGATRSHWDIKFDFWEEVFAHHHYQLGEGFYKYKYRKYQEGSLNNDELKNFFMFNLYGDPSLKVIAPNIELHTNEKRVDFSDSAEKLISIEVKNNTSQSIEGQLLGLNTEVKLKPYESKIMTTTLSKTFSGFSYEQFLIFQPNQKEKELTVAGDSILLTAHGYDVYCSRREESGNQWKLFPKINAINNENVELTIEIKPGYQTSHGIPKPITVYDDVLNPLLNPTPILSFNKVANQDELDMNKVNEKDPYVFPLMLLKLYSTKTGELVGQCNRSML